MRIAPFCIPLWLAIPMLSCQPSQVDVRATQAVLDSLLVLHAEHIVHEDIDALLANYTDDVVVRANHTEPIRGQADLRAFLAQLLDLLDVRALTYQTESLAVYGDSAWHVITYRWTTQLPDQPEQDDHGSAIVLWTRDASGAWQIKHDILNSSVPLPAPDAQ